MTSLKSLYAIAIALLMAFFVGFGISAFYPAPEFPQPPKQLEFVGENSSQQEKELITEQQRKEEACRTPANGDPKETSRVRGFRKEGGLAPTHEERRSR